MPLNKNSHRIFEAHYGATLLKASRSNNLAQSLGRLFASGRKQDVRDEHYGRGYVGFGRSVSAKQADQSTMRMLSRW